MVVTEEQKRVCCLLPIYSLSHFSNPTTWLLLIPLSHLSPLLLFSIHKSKVILNFKDKKIPPDVFYSSCCCSDWSIWCFTVRHYTLFKGPNKSFSSTVLEYNSRSIMSPLSQPKKPLVRVESRVWVPRRSRVRVMLTIPFQIWFSCEVRLWSTSLWWSGSCYDLWSLLGPTTGLKFL